MAVLTDKVRNALAVAMANGGASTELCDIIDHLQNLSQAELEFLDTVVAGTVTASKAMVVDANKDITGARNFSVTGGLLSSGPTGNGVGYSTGAGGAVTQATNKSTGVTLNKLSGQITMNNAALAAAAEVAFTLTNSTIAATDIVVVNIASGGSSASYLVTVTAVAAGSCEITVSNTSGGSLSEALVLNFAVIKGVAA